MVIAIILLLILLNAWFSMAEIGLVAVKKADLTVAAERGNRQAANVLKLIQNPEEFLSAIQVGITLLGIMEGIYGGRLVGEMLSPVLQRLPGINPAVGHSISMITGIGLITYLTIVLGELVPKSIALQMPLKVSVWTAPSLLFFSRLAYPFIKMLTYSTRFLLDKLAIHKQEKQKITESDLKKMLSLALNEGVLNKEEFLLHQHVFSFDDLTASRIMKPAAITRTVGYDYSRASLIEYIKQIPYSHFPVYDAGKKIAGVIHTKEVLLNPEKDWHALIRKTCDLSHSIKAGDILKKFRANDADFGIVFSETGEFTGIVTMQDIMEGVFGDMPERENYEKFFYQQADGSWIAYGFIHLQRIRKTLSADWLLEYESNYITLSELLAGELSHHPGKGEHLVLHNLLFTVTDAGAGEMGKVRIDIK